MPTPATTGQLRTKVSEMEIGDYIKMHHQSIAGQSPFLLTTDPSIPESEIAGNVLGTAARNKYWYMIKVAKGLLVADRVFAHTYSWDSFNSLKWIQGLPWDGGNIIPTMTSNTSPSGVASASSEHSSTLSAWYAFNKNTSDRWKTPEGVTSGWLQYGFNEAKSISAYAVTSPNLNNQYTPMYSPQDWTFEGSNDGANWNVLDTRKETGWTYNQKRMFFLSKPSQYKFYRINITSVNSGGTTLHIGELEMYETTGTIRSLTGGVAYADANGNKATTNQGYGGWPTNNEWDRYIVNFPADKIQAGKTLDDVFHYSGIYTLTQDTPMLSISVVTQRIIRKLDFSWGSSSGSSVSIGFRPVFAYKE